MVKKRTTSGAKRRNIYLDPETRRMGQQLAEMDDRSFSKLLKKLILNEHNRCFPVAK